MERDGWLEFPQEMELLGGHAGMGGGYEEGEELDQVYGGVMEGAETDSVWDPGEIKSQ